MNATLTQSTHEVPNGFFSFKSAKTGAHRTIRIRTQKEDASFKPGARLVGVLVGSDNENDYLTVGELTEAGQFRVWQKQKDSAHAKTAAFIVGALKVLGYKGGELEGQGHLNASCRCIRCNRLLTTPESEAAGIGPECAKKGGGF